jgi:hypothetical protein
VANEKISAEYARREHGVALTPSGAVDERATAALRAGKMSA